MSPLGLGNLRDPVLTNCEKARMEVINSVATLALISHTTTVTTRFAEHMSMFLRVFLEGLAGELDVAPHVESPKKLTSLSWVCF